MRKTLSIAAVLAFGTLGLAAPSIAATPPTAEPRFVQVEPGWFFMVALTEEGEVYTWGDNYYGQLGDNGPYRSTPAAIAFPDLPAGDRIKQVAAGAEHALAVSEQGRIFGWGHNVDGQVGDGSGDDEVRIPVLLDALPGLASDDRAVSVAAGSVHSLALTARGEVYGWGANYYAEANYDNLSGAIDSPSRFASLAASLGSARHAVAIEAGNTASFAVTDDGHVLAWGYSGDWRLGVVTPYSYGFYALGFPGLSSGDGIVDVSIGDNHGLAVSAEGQVYAWGDNSSGQLGTGGGDAQTPVPVAVFPGLDDDDRVVGVSAGVEYSLAVTAEGQVYAWGSNGWNGEGLLGIGLETDAIRNTPQLVADFPDVKGDSPLVAVRASIYLSAAVSETGGVYTWGSGSAGGLGAGSEDDATRPANILLGELSGSVALDSPPQEGASVSAVPSGWPSGTVFDYTWVLDGDEIPGAESAAYTPSADDVDGELTVHVTASAENWAQGEAESPAAVVAAPPIEPTITTATLPAATAGDLYTATIAVTGTAPITFAVTDGELPDGLLLDEATGELSGIPTVAGDRLFTVTATSDFGEDGREFELVVDPGVTAVLDLAPSADTVDQGGWIEITVSGTDGFGNPTGGLTDDVEITSDVPSDEIDGNRITFPHASPHLITVSYGPLSESIVIEVRPGADGLLGLTGVDVWPVGLSAVLLSGGAVSLLFLARRRRIRMELGLLVE